MTPTTATPTANESMPRPYVPPPLTEERKRELVERWRRIESGEEVPQAERWPTAVEEAVRAEVAKLPPRPWWGRACEYLRSLLCRGEGRWPGPVSEVALRLLRQDLGLSYVYGGHPVICYDTPDGTAVIAAGQEEFLLFLGCSTESFDKRTRQAYPGVWEELG